MVDYLFEALACYTLQFYFFLVAFFHPTGEHGSKIVRARDQNHLVDIILNTYNSDIHFDISTMKLTKYHP